MSDSMKDVILMILVGAMAFRGSCSLMYNALYRDRGPEVFDRKFIPREVYPSRWASTPLGMRIINAYMWGAIPIGFINGFLLHYRILECFIVGLGTWIGMVIFNVISRRGPEFQFIFFGFINLVWLVINIIRAFVKLGVRF